MLYLHTPFCESKCPYCAFNSFSNKTQLIDDYFKALQTQLKYELKRFQCKKSSINSFYIGGGTPSVIKACKYDKIFEIVKPFLTQTCEITIEANPTSAKKEWLKEMFKLGVNRLSIGIQSLNNEKLLFLGRIHKSSDAIRAVSDAFEVGFENISGDFIYDTPFDDLDFVQKELDGYLALGLSHISAYSLTIEPNTPFENKPHFAKQNLEAARQIVKRLQENGFEWYEVSSFAKKRSKHNSGYWQHKNYIGVGAGGVGFLSPQRIYPQNELEEYIEAPLAFSYENLTQDELKDESLLLGLRCDGGFDEKTVSKKQKEQATILCDEKKLFFKDGRYFNPDFFLADEIALFLS